MKLEKDPTFSVSQPTVLNTIDRPIIWNMHCLDLYNSLSVRMSTQSITQIYKVHCLRAINFERTYMMSRFKIATYVIGTWRVRHTDEGMDRYKTDERKLEKPEIRMSDSVYWQCYNRMVAFLRFVFTIFVTLGLSRARIRRQPITLLSALSKLHERYGHCAFVDTEARASQRPWFNASDCWILISITNPQHRSDIG